jgi:capsule polysaccharide export protein KpsC/LpsZ
MALVKITNGEVELKVSNGAFINSYKNCGFSIVESDTNETVNLTDDIADITDNTDETDQDFTDLLLKPISSWNKQELKEFAAAKELDISGMKSAQEAKDLIKEYIDNLQ